MKGDVVDTSRMARPPRPVAARLPRTTDDDADDVAFPVTAEGGVAPKAATAPAAAAPETEAHMVRELVERVRGLERVFYDHTTPEERAYVRTVTCPPHHETFRNVYSDPTSSFATACLVSLAAGVLLSELTQQRSSVPTFRGASEACQSVVDRFMRFV
jgi:hypothetical protein